MSCGVRRARESKTQYISFTFQKGRTKKYLAYMWQSYNKMKDMIKTKLRLAVTTRKDEVGCDWGGGKLDASKVLQLS
jgi:hypothetical protein